MALTTQDLVAGAREQIRELDTREARERIDRGATPLDVREAEELAAGYLPGAVHIPRGFLEFKLASNPVTQDTSSELLVYCKTGGRAALAAQTLQTLGYTNVAIIRGGFDGWAAAGEPVDGAARDEEE
jgi:rhodanese-related sulfurtransferase